VHNREQRKARALDPGNQTSISLYLRRYWTDLRGKKFVGERKTSSLQIFSSVRVFLERYREIVEKFSAHDPGNRIAERNARELDIAIAIALAERRCS